MSFLNSQKPQQPNAEVMVFGNKEALSKTLLF